jgi:hypothetical protein
MRGDIGRLRESSIVARLLMDRLSYQEGAVQVYPSAPCCVDQVRQPENEGAQRMVADQAMVHAAEKRRDERIPCRSAVVWAYFNKTETRSASLRDFSRAGACLDCSEAPIHGSTIVLRMEAYPAGCREGCKEEDICPWPRSIALGEVRWCRQITGGNPQRFGVGLKFHLLS